MLFELPVSPISRKILLHDYEEEPIKPGRHDVLYHQLCYDRGPRLTAANLHSMLRSTIVVDLTADMYANNKKRLFRVGHLLYLSHMERMMLFIEAQTLATGNAWGALELFYTKYEIEEDDFPMESAYKRWQRFQAGIGYNVREVAKSVRKIYPVVVRVPFTAEMCDDLYTLVLCHLNKYFFSYTNLYLLAAARAMLHYIYYEYGDFTYEQIGKILGCKATTVNFKIQVARRFIKGDPEIKHSIDRLSYLVRQSAAQVAS